MERLPERVKSVTFERETIHKGHKQKEEQGTQQTNNPSQLIGNRA